MKQLELLYIPLLWFAYGAQHSVLASLDLKGKFEKRWPRASSYYRLAYNLVAIALLLPILAYVASLPSETLWVWQGTWHWIASSVLALSIVGFVVSSSAYDMLAFLGLRAESHTAFRVRGMHRVLRHPWYFFALCVLWTRDMTAAGLVQSLCITTYLIIGSKMEEQRLIASIGNAYKLYRSLVPGLFPFPGRYVTLENLAQIESSAQV